MIELLVRAERSLAMGRLEEAERLYRRALEQDPRNAMAVVGLARLAVERGDDEGAYRLAADALERDPENAVAQRLATRLHEVFGARGTPVELPPALRRVRGDGDRPGERRRDGRGLLDRLFRREKGA